MNPNSGPLGGLSRRQFMVTGGAAASAFALVPRHVLGGPGFVAPSEKITLACIGFGTQAIREIGGILARPEVQIVAVCDVEKDGVNYLEWGKNDLRNTIRRLIENPTWREGVNHVPGGRDVGKEIVETYYAKQRGKDQFKGCATYVDFRELLEKEKDVTAVKVMTPDHTHATISIAALKKGKNVIVHKPLANRLLEARAVIETARARRSPRIFCRPVKAPAQKQALEMIKNGAIGTLREIHNWSIAADVAPVPDSPDRHAARPRRISTGRSGSAHRWIARITPTTRTRISAAGMSSAAGPSPTWGTTASGRFSSSSNWTLRSASNRHPATSARFRTRSARGSRTTSLSRPPARFA